MTATNTNALITELTNFLKSVLGDLDAFISDIDYCLLFNQYDDDYCSVMDKLQNIGYNGSISSIVSSDEFWDILMRDFVEYMVLFDRLEIYKFTLIEKTRDGIREFIEPSLIDSSRGTNVNLWMFDYITLKWDEVFKEQLREWAQNEFCVCPK